MLSYQHIFHAGNHADLLKHFVLYKVIDSLNKKEKPYTFYDTHSASALYDLYDSRSQKTKEAQNGVISVMNNKDFPDQAKDFFIFLQEYTKKSLYPGSPLIELNCLRKIDSLILSEIHPQEIVSLKTNINNAKNINSPNVHIHNRDGWEMLKALTPPQTKRGAVLIDPSYEEQSDYQKAIETITNVNKKWTNGIILLWYPLLAYKEDKINNMIQTITNNCKNNLQNIEIQKFELLINKKESHKEVSLDEYLLSKNNNPPRLYGSGVLVINCPYMLKENIESTIDYLQKKLSS